MFSLPQPLPVWQCSILSPLPWWSLVYYSPDNPLTDSSRKPENIWSLLTSIQRVIRCCLNLLILLSFRNNLTVVDALVVSGKGATSNLYIKEATKVMEEGYNTDTYLRYDVKEASLKPCLISPGKRTPRSPSAWLDISGLIWLPFTFGYQLFQRTRRD